MPELPEVEAARRAIEDNCLGKKITKAIIANDSKVIERVSASDFESSLLGKTIVSAHRKGKNLWLHLDSRPFPSFQFGMAGAIYIKGVAVTKYKRSAVKDNDEWPSKYSKFFVELDDGLELSFTDKRRFARVRLLEDPTSVPPISELGPDALFEPMTVDEFTEFLSKKKIAIKALLLDQSYISGIGNWIADEVLYQARIHPLQVSSSLSKENCATLHKCIKEVIEKAVEVGADSSHFPSNWIFHSREKKPGKAFVDGKKIDFISVGGRTSAYVPELQKLSGTQATKAAGKPRNRLLREKGEDEDIDEDGDDGDEPTSEEEEMTKSTKPKKGGNPRGRGKKPPMKRKTEESDDDNSDGSSEEDDEDSKKKAGKVKTNTSNKQAKTAKTSQKTDSTQNGKKPKKRAK
ncbi:LOW QUALITY PROTEIN: formamidopyrimidine-DNA glycosylase-like [Durio zibethinus]|uniref:LOW QUALITY PROTEIN: formamidopyrimidine-DNA glycosylase-like n=1 Tax=Durio zibethinus TaxID=66656 RepID=A0A6P5WFJ6_DURZI|nr:LOW QUALITY PROTEIN: formamidopyrimidine-DNA glycosylase-like [Durio zibethinus]